MKGYTGGSKKSIGSFKNTDLCFKVFLAFIDTAIFPSLFFKAGVILNYNGLKYLKTI